MATSRRSRRSISAFPSSAPRAFARSRRLNEPLRKEPANATILMLTAADSTPRRTGGDPRRPPALSSLPMSPEILVVQHASAEGLGLLADPLRASGHRLAG